MSDFSFFSDYWFPNAVLPPAEGGTKRLLRSTKRKIKPSDNWQPDGPDRLKNQPPELTYRMLFYLTPEDLSRLGMCAKYLRGATNNEALWKAMCRLKYESFKHHPLNLLHPAGVYSPSTVLSTLSPAECKGILDRRGVPKNTWEQLCEEAEKEDATYEADLEELRSLVLTSEGDLWPTPEVMEGVEYGNKWKSSYVATILDLERTSITRQELISYEWFYVSHGRWSMRDEDVARVEFNTNGYRHGTKGWPMRQTWRVDRGGRVQVAGFPLHQTRRDANGGWIFGNGYVTYKSICGLWEAQGKKDDPPAEDE
ncbi:hypothetical protein M427DRAFT_63050 [Gonapodya prolifera JEL478]|uniref:F-box domain-containing protein n=1 Tax=Gonapodya prolifera (strain JEL478) TaxID=1344416 RepID=A0A138ZZR1_GONPJ|nr:hypothetical protein M427DRAFT_63050 [Gonapodya prolifera JEL478]|eukprot:KXS09990.1 hypothetical protein M427DRAFT_63050 [Gonapodya prolifera JEL478]